MKRVLIVLLSVALLGACSDSTSSEGYEWTATPEEASAVGAAREMDAQAAAVWAAYSDGLLLHFIYDLCIGLSGASDVGEFLDGKVAEQGEAVLLPLVVGSPYICPEQRDAVGNWINEKAANE
jgi:hypothetical protein